MSMGEEWVDLKVEVFGGVAQKTVFTYNSDERIREMGGRLRGEHGQATCQEGRILVMKGISELMGPKVPLRAWA